jgi:YHS domain-containing protein
MEMLDPVCDMIVDMDEARSAGLTMEIDGREYAFCGDGCLKAFAKNRGRYIPKVAAWLASQGAKR